MKIYYDINTDKNLKENNLHSFKNYVLINELKNNKKDKLSGFLIISNKKVLLVKPKKFKGKKHRWSIPKGKVEGGKFKSALRELEEETGIKLDDDIKKLTEKVIILYKKNGRVKKLTTYILELDKDFIDNHKNITNDEINKKIFNKKEIYKAKFFTKENALSKIESGQKPLLKIINNKL